MSNYRNKDILSIENLKNDFFLLTWKMTGWCNYRCPYCINSKYRTEYSDWRSEEDLIKTAKRLNEILKLNGVTLPIKLKLIGGEVTYYDIPKILEQFDKISKLLITSNFSNSIEYYKNLYSYCYNKKINLILILSKHDQNIDFIDKASELTSWCKQNNMLPPQISLVVTKDFNFDQLIEFEEKGLNRIKLVVEKLPDGSMVELSEENKLKLHNYDLKYKTGNNYKVTFLNGETSHFSNIYQFINELDCGGFLRDNYYCDAGNNSLVIGYDNRVWLDKCALLNNTCLGTIWDDIKISTGLRLCKVDPKNPEFDKCNLCSSVSVYKNL